MFRVESKKRGPKTTIRISGRLDRRHLEDLEALCAAAETTVILDLSEVQSLDEDAIRWLSRWRARGERVFGESPYVRFLLERARKDSER